jgi:hypothetical protein
MPGAPRVLVRVKPVPRPFLRSPRIGLRRRGRFYFIWRDAAVAVSVETHDEHARFFDELVARDLAVLIFVEIAEFRFGQGRVGFLDGIELGWTQTAVVVAIARLEQPVHEALPFLAGINAVVVGVPDRRPVVEHGVGPGSGLGDGERTSCQKPSDRDADPNNGFSVRHIVLLSLQPSAMVPNTTDDRGGASCPDPADTSAMRRAYTLLERVEKPLPPRDVRL